MMQTDEFLKFMRGVEERNDALLWKLPKVPKKSTTVFKDPFMYIRAWSVPFTTGCFLHDLVMQRKPRCILELGMSTGYSTCFLAHAARGYGGVVHTIEKFPAKVRVAKENFAAAQVADTVTIHEGEIKRILTDWKSRTGGKKIDLLFMDADKQYYADYLQIIEPFLSDDICILVDNAGNFADRMKTFFNYLEDNKHRWKTQFIDMDNGLLRITRA